jgi:RNA polymerase sigma-70 factor (ECF subfamily)
MATDSARSSASFDELYRATNRRLLQYAYAMTGDFATAQDLTQEAYIRAWRNWRQVESFERADAWLRLVVTRLVTDRWRRLRTSRRLGGAFQRPDTVPPPSEDGVILVAALRRLPVAQRRAICMYHLLDLPISQIAIEAGVAEGTVKSWLTRGRATLAEILGPDLFQDTPTAVTSRREHPSA